MLDWTGWVRSAQQVGLERQLCRHGADCDGTDNDKVICPVFVDADKGRRTSMLPGIMLTRES